MRVLLVCLTTPWGERGLLATVEWTTVAGLRHRGGDRLIEPGSAVRRSPRHRPPSGFQVCATSPSRSRPARPGGPRHGRGRASGHASRAASDHDVDERGGECAVAGARGAWPTNSRPRPGKATESPRATRDGAAGVAVAETEVTDPAGTGAHVWRRAVTMGPLEAVQDPTGEVMTRKLSGVLVGAWSTSWLP